uniref:Ig-like domain-containing protein n=1 Tax=Timema genevievae TaxID=629358 RepID=A0A7R9PMU6_TIMGE|nr:unnamed protein product [Timema genevievae]
MCVHNDPQRHALERLHPPHIRVRQVAPCGLKFSLALSRVGNSSWTAQRTWTVERSRHTSQYSTAEDFLDTVLRVLITDPEQYGNYTCNASNELGRAEGQIELLAGKIWEGGNTSPMISSLASYGVGSPQRLHTTSKERLFVG